MNRSVVIHQPDFLPWLGFFDRLLKADLYIVLDHAQFVTRGWIHRDKIKTPRGPAWITLPLQKSPVKTPINEMMLSVDGGWRKEHLNFIYGNYRPAPHFKEIFPHIEALYAAPHTTMVDINLASIEMLSNLLHIDVPRAFSSEMFPVGNSTAMNIDLLEKVGATEYVSGLGARAYLDASAFAHAGIKLIWQEFHHPIYPQLHGDFAPMLSTIDALFNCGAGGTRNILKGKSI